MILLAFCKNCTWEILPMLLGAWLLGWLFWYLFHKPKYQNKIKDLNSNIGALQTAANTASLAANEPNEDFLRLSEELKSAQTLNQDFNLQLRRLRTELENKRHSDQASQSKLNDLKQLLSVSKESNLELKTDLDQLNTIINNTKKRNADLQQLLLNCETEKETLKKELAAKEIAINKEANQEPSNNNAYEDAVRNQFVVIPEPKVTQKIADVYENELEEVEEIEPVFDANPRIEILKEQPAYDKWLEPSNLKIVEGVGPKIESLMKDAGINNWEDLSNTEPSTIQNILNEAGPRYRVHDPKSWPLQARLAFKNDWIVLINLQKEMGSSKSSSKDKNNRSKVEKLVMKAKGIKAFAPDDLKIIEGVGPKIESLLKADGINDWNDIAATKPERIKAILTAAGDRYRLADPTTWPKQAALAAAGNWEELKAYQDRLKGGIE